MCEKTEVEILDPYLEIMSVRKPTKIQRIIDSVPRPPRSRPPRPGFPQWDMAPLYQSLCLPTGMPKEITIYHRDNLGEKLWKGYGYAEYFLKDPYAHEIQFFPYEARHDPNLKGYYDRPNNRKLMLKNGLITPDGKVFCTLAQFNLFRRFLYRTQLFHLHNAIWWHDTMEREKLELRRFHGFLQRDIQQEERHEYFYEITAKAREERQAAEEKHREKLEKQQRAKLRRTRSSQKRRKMRQLATKERSVEAGLRVYEKLQESQYARRLLALRTLRNMHDGALERRFKRCMRLYEQREMKDIQAWARYKCKVHSQLERYQREAELLEWDRDMMDEALVLRNRFVEIEQRRMADLLEHIQTKHLREMRAKKAQKMKEKYMQAVTKAWTIPEGISPWVIEQAVLAALAKNKSPTGGHEVFATLQDIKEKLDGASQMPEAVMYVLDVLLENVIKQYIRNNVTRILEEVQEKVANKVNEIAAAARGRRRSDPQRRGSVSSSGKGSERRSSVSSSGREGGRRRSSLQQITSLIPIPPMSDAGSSTTGGAYSTPATTAPTSAPTISAPTTATSAAPTTPSTPATATSRRRSSLGKEAKKTSIIPLSRGISFGEVATIGKFVSAKELQPTKERPPTPVPSLEDLAVAVAQDPLDTRPKERDSTREQEKLKNIFKTLTEVLFISVFKYFEARSPVTRQTLFTGMSGTQLRFNDVVRRMTEKIAESDDLILQESDELHLAEEYLIQELGGRLPYIKESSRENLAGVRRPSI